MEDRLRENIADLLPVITEVDAPYWQGLQDHQLMVQHCKDCGNVQFPPSSLCQNCLSDNIEWIPYQGNITLWSKVRFNKSYLPQYTDVPYCVAVARLSGGQLITTRISEEHYNSIPLDAHVKLEYVETQDGTVLMRVIPA